MPFGIVGRTGPGMKQVVGFEDRSTGRGTFGARHCNQWGLYGVRVRQRRNAALFSNYFGQTCLLDRQTYMSADLYFTRDSSFFFLFIVSYPRNLLNGTQPYPATWVGSKCNLKMHARNLGYPFPLQIWGPKPPFSMIWQPKGKFNGLYFGLKHDIHNRASALQTTKGLLHRLQTT